MGAEPVQKARRDPAESRRFLRYFYDGWRPTRLGRIVNGAWAWVISHGAPIRVMLALQVPGRKTGKLTTTVLVDTTHAGEHYLVSMLGDRSEWVKNLRAAGGRAFIKRGRARPVMLTEVPPEERAPILKTYARIATSGRHHFPVAHNAPVEEFAAIAGSYPVFRIDPA